MSALVDRAVGVVRDAGRLVFDQRRAAGRLAVVHALQAGGSGLVTISLAGSLFFSISPKAAEGHVLLYLLLTIAPFALVGPALSPLLDRGRRTRRAAVAASSVLSAIACLGMARNIKDLWLFPEAFVLLVLAKLYGVARASLVPELTEPGEDLAGLNARLAVIASIAGFFVVPVGVVVLKIGAPWVLRLAALVFLAEGIAAVRLPRSPGDDSEVAESARRPPRFSEVHDARRSLGLPMRPQSVSAALTAVSATRAIVGFVEFFLAFALRRDHAASWWFGLLLVASGVGSLVGSAIVPRLRRRCSERQIIAGALFATIIGALLAGVVGGRLAQCFLCLVVGAAPTSAKPALDSIVQRAVPPALLARAFGRIETRLQLLWVLASVVGVLVPFPLRIGDAIVAIVGVVAAVRFAGGVERSGRRIAPNHTGGAAACPVPR